jgi:hypothetical protein
LNQENSDYKESLNKFDDFGFEQKLKKGKTNSIEEKEAIPKPIKKKGIPRKNNHFKYGSQRFRTLNDVGTFLLLNHKNREKHATKLLNNPEFLKWLTSQQI